MAANPMNARIAPRLDRCAALSKRRGKTVLQIPARDSAVRQALKDVWKRAPVAAISDHQIAPAVSTLIQHMRDVGFYRERLRGMRRFGNADGLEYLDLQLAPGRQAPHGRASLSVEDCVLCDNGDSLQRGLLWRDYVILPNAFPYVPLENQHVVVMPARHVPQGASKALLGDMIRYQKLAGRDGRVTMHFNGIAGNSQYHLHWQAERLKLPLQRAIEDGYLPLTRLRTDSGGAIETFDRDYFAGFFVRGKDQYVAQTGLRIIRKLDEDSATRGAYNLVLLQRGKGEARLAILPRRADDLHPRVEGRPAISMSAFSLSGIVVMPRTEMPDHFGVTARETARRTLVRPKELAWLDAL